MRGLWQMSPLSLINLLANWRVLFTRIPHLASVNFGSRLSVLKAYIFKMQIHLSLQLTGHITRLSMHTKLLVY